MKFLCETNNKQCSANSDVIFAELSLNTFTAAVYKLSYRLLYESMEKFAHWFWCHRRVKHDRMCIVKNENRRESTYTHCFCSLCSYVYRFTFLHDIFFLVIASFHNVRSSHKMSTLIFQHTQKQCENSINSNVIRRKVRHKKSTEKKNLKMIVDECWYFN